MSFQHKNTFNVQIGDLPIPLIVTDQNGVILASNQSAQSLAACSSEAQIGKLLSYFFVSLNHAYTFVPHENSFSEEDPVVFSCLPTISGSGIRQLLVKCTLITSESAEESWLWTFTTVDNYYAHIKGAGNLGEERYKLLLDNAFDAIYLFKDDHFLYVNKKFTELTGYTFEEATHTDFDLNVTLTPKSKLVLEERSRKRKNNEFLDPSYRFEIVDKTGKIHQVEISTVQINFENNLEILGIIRDITEQTEVKKALEWEKTYFENLYSSVPYGIVLVDESDNVLDINKAFEGMFGYTLEQMKGSQINNFIVPDFHKKEGSFLTRKITSGETIEIETVRKRKDGKLIHVRIIGKQTFAPDGKMLVFGIYQDISERVAFNNQLNQQKLYFEQLFQAIPYGIILIGSDNSIHDCNEGFINIFGYSFAELLYGFDFSAFIPAELEQEAADITNRVNQGEKVYVETKRLHKDGSIVDVAVTAKLLKRTDEESKIIAIFQDISDRKSAEKDLEFERRLMDSLLDNLPDTIYFKDTESRFIRVNRAQADVLGVNSPIDAVGKSDIDFFNDEHGEYTKIEEKKIFETGERQISVQEHVKTAKGWRWFTSTKVPIYDNNHQVVGLAGLSRDISEIKEMEAILIEREENLRKLNAEKDKLFSVIAHDLRSPFNAFLMLTEMLTDDSMVLEEAESRTLIDSIHKSAVNLYDLLENLLSWSMLQRGLSEFEPADLNLRTIIQNSVDAISSSTRNKMILMDISVSEDIMVVADQRMLSSILRNLISNAVKFTPKNGKISISSELEHNNRVKISITDSGIGMSPDLQNRLFSFETRGRKGTEGEPSSGLGLIMVKDFITKHQSQLKIVSEVNIGSTFSFSLKLAE
jgi:PAS domain S-box-containing protein